MAERSHSELDKIARSVTDWRRISDNLFKVGPLKVGLDGVLTWIPGVGDAYTVGASAFLLAQAVRAGASRPVLVKMGLLLGTDAVIGAVPLLGDAFDVVFRAHARSARVLTEHIAVKQAALPRPGGPPPPDRAPRPAPPSPGRRSDSDEQGQARRVEALRAEVQARGGSILRPRP